MWKSLSPQHIVIAVSLVLNEEPGRPSSSILGTIIESYNGLCWKETLKII